jgi:glutamyl-Q tRNA(Asp) synthetase
LLIEVIERTAPSPTGDIHLGHVYSALTAYRNAKANNGFFKLRIEDIDITRCKIEYENAIIKNLSWLGLKWDEKIMRQRNRYKSYNLAIDQLLKEDLLYPCSCSRRDVKKALSAPHIEDISNLVYPGTCKIVKPNTAVKALRLNIDKAIKKLGNDKLYFYETGITVDNFHEKRSISNDTLKRKFGDLVVARKDIGTSYNLSVVIDDSAQKVTHVTRGYDLLDVTPIQVLLQRILGLQTPTYHHHKLICDDDGKKLSKRSSSQSISNLIREGLSSSEVIEMAFSL